MELTLNIDKQTARKIQALSILAECDASDITDLFSTHLDTIITNEILQILGKDGDFYSGPLGEASEEVLTETEPTAEKEPEIENKGEIEAQNEQILEIDEIAEEGFDGPTIFGVADSMGQKIYEVVEEELPEKIQEEFEDMVVKTKSGEETGYEDEIMADAQAMAEEEFDGQEDVIAAAAGSLGGAKRGLSRIGDDSPRYDGGIVSNTPDVLPVDLGIEKASTDDGGMAFFGHVIKGEKGDKAARNKVTKKKRKK